MAENAQARLDALEERAAHQETTTEDLSRVVAAQWDEIDRLKKLVTLLAERVGEAEQRVSAVAPPEPPPPHY
jgi:Uncharacterized protein conserved in bacteria